MQPEELPVVFPPASEWLVRIPRLLDRYTLEDVRKEIEDGNWQLWIAFDKEIEGALLTTLIQYPKRRELHMLGISGRRMKEWIGLIGTIEKYGRNNGCVVATMSAVRRGFARLLPGYRGNRLVLEKVL